MCAMIGHLRAVNYLNDYEMCRGHHISIAYCPFVHYGLKMLADVGTETLRLGDKTDEKFPKHFVFSH